MLPDNSRILNNKLTTTADGACAAHCFAIGLGIALLNDKYPAKLAFLPPFNAFYNLNITSWDDLKALVIAKCQSRVDLERLLSGPIIYAYELHQGNLNIDDIDFLKPRDADFIKSCSEMIEIPVELKLSEEVIVEYAIDKTDLLPLTIIYKRPETADAIAHYDVEVPYSVSEQYKGEQEDNFKRSELAKNKDGICLPAPLIYRQTLINEAILNDEVAALKIISNWQNYIENYDFNLLFQGEVIEFKSKRNNIVARRLPAAAIDILDCIEDYRKKTNADKWQQCRRKIGEIVGGEAFKKKISSLPQALSKAILEGRSAPEARLSVTVKTNSVLVPEELMPEELVPEELEMVQSWYQYIKNHEFQSTPSEKSFKITRENKSTFELTVPKAVSSVLKQFFKAKNDANDNPNSDAWETCVQTLQGKQFEEKIAELPSELRDAIKAGKRVIDRKHLNKILTLLNNNTRADFTEFDYSILRNIRSYLNKKQSELNKTSATDNVVKEFNEKYENYLKRLIQNCDILIAKNNAYLRDEEYFESKASKIIDDFLIQHLSKPLHISNSLPIARPSTNATRNIQGLAASRNLESDLKNKKPADKNLSEVTANTCSIKDEKKNEQDKIEFAAKLLAEIVMIASSVFNSLKSFREAPKSLSSAAQPGTVFYKSSNMKEPFSEPFSDNPVTVGHG